MNEETLEPVTQHGIFAVPTIPSSSYPLTSALIQFPYPWGELHVSVCAFEACVNNEIKESLLKRLATLNEDYDVHVQPVTIEEYKGW